MEALRRQRPFLKEKFGEHVLGAWFSCNEPCWLVDPKDKSSPHCAGWLTILIFQLYKKNFEL
jgi:hypothetical protein